ncbi:MAG: beta-galactosidase, partial [Erysipelothrix sp.]|nr:beta-galactosidase [Erysipelothrix sp.]
MTNTEKLTQRIRTIDFNHNWKFSLNDDLISPSNKHYDDSLWEQVTLPHDWSIFFDFDHDSPAQNEGGLLNGGHGWYRKSFNLDETLEGSRILINFSGVYMDSTVFVNGAMVGNYPNGYTPFEYDITDYVYFDSRPNVISVKVVNEQPSSRWYSGSGIYRNVSLSILNPVHVQTYGTRIETPNLENEYQDKVNVKVSTKLSRDLNSNQRLSYEIRDSNDQVITSDSSSDLWVSKPNLWSIDSPTMYTL